jgi:hypothetical protein
MILTKEPILLIWLSSLLLNIKDHSIFKFSMRESEIIHVKSMDPIA